LKKDSGAARCVSNKVRFSQCKKENKMQRKVMTIGVVACVLALMVGGLALAQQGGGGGRQRGQGGGQGGPGGNFDPAQMRQRMMDRMKEQLGADDAAWKVLEPRLTKVMEANRAVGGGMRGMMGMMGGMRGQRGQGGPGGDQGGAQQADRRGRGPQGEQTAVDKAVTDLRTTLENSSASPEDIKTKLTAVRQAREKAKADLAAAQADLKKILTVRQEAVLVEMGQLE
jgi:hypothetical protein